MDNAGKLNKKITFYKQTEREILGSEKTGQQLKKLRTVWASVRATGGTESYEAQRLTNTVSYDIRTRFIPELMDVGLIIGYKGERYEIRSVVNVREEDTELAFTCVKILKAGCNSHEFGCLSEL
ncbi:MAG: phage head closure protein [Faecalibacterium sp.]|nr:phage head closure protein [Ruminococcus sp.]MCM1392102.1 phage head closure protein [Ruminococcus sp.]MCM1485799.1 phage head closure protein [Faecalibacterium sp.]